MKTLPPFARRTEFDDSSEPRAIGNARRSRAVVSATVGLCAVGLVFVGRYFWIGVPTLAWTILIAISLGLLNLLFLLRTERITLFANLGTAVLYGCMVIICSFAGGLESTDFSWLMIIPAVAALAVGIRAAWIWLGIVWVSVLVFWTLGEWISVDLIPIAVRDFHSLENRLGLSVALALLTTTFIRGLRLAEDRYFRVNRSLACEIENRKKAQIALRESEESYRDLVENSPTMIFTHDLEGTVLSANRTLADFLGSGPEDLVGQDCSCFLLPAAEREREQYFQRIRLEGEAFGLAEVVTSVGETKLLDYHSTLRTKGVEEPIVRGVARDVTEQERARRALVRQVEQEELVSGIATRFISVEGAELQPAIETGLGELGGFAEVDWAALFLLSERGNDIVETYSWSAEGGAISIPKSEGKSIDRLSWLAERLNQLETVIVHDTEEIETDAAEELRELLGREVRSALLVPLVGREGLLGVLTLVLAQQRRRWMQENLVLAYISGYVFTSAVLRVRHEERTLQLENEVLQARKMESLGLVAGGIAHDFNNHLMGILGNASLVRDQLARGSDAWCAVQQISDSAQEAAQLTSQMLSFSGSANVVPAMVDLDQLLDEVVQRQRAQIPEGPEIDLWLSRSLPAVEVDVGQMRQVVRNLIINSIEALQGKSGRVQVRSGVVELSAETVPGGLRPLKQKPAPGPYVFVQVSDSGCGIQSEDLPKIFDPFFSSRFKGRGLGLAAVHGIVRAHEGVIEVSSDPGRGTVMRILLPAAGPTRVDRAADPARPEAADKLQGRGAILVVDDEESVVQVISRMLELKGYEVLTASSEQQVIDRARHDGDGVKAVLFDFTLPEGDPGETLREIRTNGLKAPVIMMSGFSREQVMERVGEDGVAGFLEKPFGSQVLLSELERVLEQ